MAITTGAAVTTIAPTEALWTLGALVGALINLWAYHDASVDLIALRVRGLNGAREIVARANVRNELLRTCIQLVFLLIGVIAMGEPPANPATPVTALGVVITGGLIAAEIVLVTKALLDRRDRRRVIALLSRATEAS